jgi:IclR family pca regulon transcriptional regulator
MVTRRRIASRPPNVVPSNSAAKQHQPTPAKESTLFVHSVDKAMRVLMAFDGTRRHLSLSQIAALTGLDLSATQRFTYTLTTLGYLNKDEETRTYELSPRVLDFTYHYLASNELVRRATPYVQQLSKETEETSNITVLDDTDIVFVLRIVSRHVLNPSVVVGTRLPAYCTAPGLAILASCPDEEVDRILARSNLIQHSPYTVAKPKAIRERLIEIREKGYAHTEGEYYLDDISTAVAILGSGGRAVGAINVAVAKARWGGHVDERRIADLLISAASAVSTQH